MDGRDKDSICLSRFRSSRVWEYSVKTYGIDAKLVRTGNGMLIETTASQPARPVLMDAATPFLRLA